MMSIPQHYFYLNATLRNTVWRRKNRFTIVTSDRIRRENDWKLETERDYTLLAIPLCILLHLLHPELAFGFLLILTINNFILLSRKQVTQGTPITIAADEVILVSTEEFAPNTIHFQPSKLFTQANISVKVYSVCGRRVLKLHNHNDISVALTRKMRIGYFVSTIEFDYLEMNPKWRDQMMIEAISH